MPPDIKSAFWNLVRMGKADFPPAAFEFTYRVIRQASRRAGGYRHLDPVEAGTAFRAAAALEFGKLAPWVLEHWGLKSGRDLGHLIGLLAKQNCLTLRAGESMEEYAIIGPFQFE